VDKAILRMLLSMGKQVSHIATMAARSTGEDKMKYIHDLKRVVEEQVDITQRRLICRSITSGYRY